MTHNCGIDCKHTLVTYCHNCGKVYCEGSDCYKEWLPMEVAIKNNKICLHFDKEKTKERHTIL